MKWLYFNLNVSPMRVENLHRAELLELHPEGCVVQFAGQRSLSLDALVVGLGRVLSRAQVSAVRLGR
jgi:hypothetical protein